MTADDRPHGGDGSSPSSDGGDRALGDGHDASGETGEGRHEPIWIDTSARTDYGPLESDRHVDTAVVGGGIAGVATAARLDAAGQSVAVVERDRILDGVTGHTTAKVTSLHGLVYDHLLDHFGADRARQYAEANEAAVETVAETVERRDIDCGFRRAPAYTYVRPGDDRRDVRAEVEAARRLDLPVSYVESADLPFEVGAAVRFDDQALFHPRKYLLALAEGVADGDGHVFERTTVRDVADGEPCRVETDRGEITADSVVVASHFPIEDDALYFARLSPKRSYVLAVRLDGDAPDGMYYYPRDPYFSVRPHASEDDLVLVGGENHRTGHAESTAERYRALERRARERLPVESIEYRWATQDHVSADGVPLIGQAGPGVDDVYVATGFGGWGMTNGIAAASILADRILEREPRWADVFRPTRTKFGASAPGLLANGRHTARHLFERYVERRSPLDPSALDPGEADVFGGRDEPVAAYRDEEGDLHAVSAVCSHMGCLVSWNDGERSWDCACHGSRFDVDGTAVDTPAVEGLEPVDLDTDGGR